jgi:polysaccharide biosynthesis/export protein
MKRTTMGVAWVFGFVAFSVVVTIADLSIAQHRIVRLGVGDVLGITIFEAGAGGLFIPAETPVRRGNYVTLPDQEVDVQGNISVPYAGPIRAQARTAVELQAAIVDALKDIALKPQAVVSLVAQRAPSR